MNDEKIINPWNDKYAKYYNKLLLSNPTKKFGYKRVDYIVTIQRELNDWEILIVDWGRHKLIRGHADFDEDFAMVVDDSTDNDLLEKAKQFQLDGEYEPAKGTDILYIFNQAPTYDIYPANEDEIGLYLINGTYYKCEEVEGELKWVKVFEMAEMADIKQSDWLQNSNEEQDFIKNRTHYLTGDYIIPIETNGEESVIVDMGEYTVSETNLYSAYVTENNIETRYNLTYSRATGCSNLSVDDLLNLYVYDDGGRTLWLSESRYENIEKVVIVQNEVVHKLNEIYIPASIARQSAIESLDSTATIASESDDIVTIKNGLVQTDGLVENNEENDIVLAKVAKTGSYNDLEDKPTIPEQGMIYMVDGDTVGAVRGVYTSEDPMGNYALQEGWNTSATGFYSHAEGIGSAASGYQSHAEGSTTHATGQSSHAEGSSTSASKAAAHAEGSTTIASGAAAHSEGSTTTASGDSAHSEGHNTNAAGRYSHAEGYYTIANHQSQHVFGEYNIPDSNQSASTAKGDYVEIVGNGTYGNESNARTLDWNGNESVAGMLRIGSTSTGGALLKYESNALKISFDNGSTWLTVSAS